MHSIVYTRVQNAFWCGLIRPFLCTQNDILECCEHKSTSGGINNLIWIFSLHFDIRCIYMPENLYPRLPSAPLMSQESFNIETVRKYHQDITDLNKKIS